MNQVDLEKMQELAAKMAGEWWAEKLTDKFSHGKERFAEEVTSRVLSELRGECHWTWYGTRVEGRGGLDGSARTVFDYSPMHCLGPALEAAFPGVSEDDLKRALPEKHYLTVYHDKLLPAGHRMILPEIIVEAQQ